MEGKAGDEDARLHGHIGQPCLSLTHTATQAGHTRHQAHTHTHNATEITTLSFIDYLSLPLARASITKNISPKNYPNIMNHHTLIIISCSLPIYHDICCMYVKSKLFNLN